MRLTFNKTLYELPLVGAASFRNVKKFDVWTSKSLKQFDTSEPNRGQYNVSRDILVLSLTTVT